MAHVILEQLLSSDAREKPTKQSLPASPPNCRYTASRIFALSLLNFSNRRGGVTKKKTLPYFVFELRFSGSENMYRSSLLCVCTDQKGQAAQQACCLPPTRLCTAPCCLPAELCRNIHKQHPKSFRNTVASL